MPAQFPAAEAAESLRWAGKANCRGEDPHEFVAGTDERKQELVEDFCDDDCPVRQECLDYAVDNRISVGVWGGMTGPQREAWARNRSA